MRTSEIVVVSNRLPVQRDEQEGQWKTSPGGLVSALSPVLRELDSTWIGWVGRAGRAPAPFSHGNIRHLPVPLSRKELETYYEGCSNRTFWPLYHDGIRPPEYHRHWWHPYVEVNRRFAQEAARCTAEGGIVWVQDYHLQLAPAMLRALRPDVRIGFFLHIPFPPQELFSQLPWRQQVLEGLMGADVIGFQTRIGAENFAHLCERYTSAVCEDGGLLYQDRHIRVGAFPISIDFEEFAGLAGQAPVIQRARKLREQLGSKRKIILGVDRLDYTKGIDRRLQAYRELLISGTRALDDMVLVQVAVPSRERVGEYRKLRSRVEQFVGEINGEYGVLGRSPVHYLHKSLEQQELVALYLAADVMVVTPFRDGMNLVAKEYAASRLDDMGVLILSEFTGSAKELTSAVLVNPHDTDGLAAAMDDALGMPSGEQQRRMRDLRETVARNDVYRWAECFLGALREP